MSSNIERFIYAIAEMRYEEARRNPQDEPRFMLSLVTEEIERGLIEEVGRKEAPGRPIQWGITKRFLKHFGLKSAADIQHIAFP